MNIRLTCLVIPLLVGVSSLRAQTGVRNDAGLQGSAGAASGFFETVQPVNYPTGATGWWHLLDIRHSTQTNNYAMQMAGGFFDQNFYLRKTNNNAQQPWQRIVTESNGVINLAKLDFQSSLGQSFFTGRQLGATYTFGSGIFRALTDNPNGAQNFYFDGVTAGNRLFSVRADGQGYFAGSLGVGTVTPRQKFDLWGGKMAITGEDFNGTALITSAAGIAYFGNNAYDNGLAVSINGRVGIGTAVPEGKLHLKYDGTAINGANPIFGGSGLIIQAATGGRFSDKGSQIEFVIPANSDGSNFYGQGRIITVAANTQNSNASGRMILGTRRQIGRAHV